MSSTKTFLWIIGLALLLVLQYRIWFDDSGVLANRSLSQRLQLATEDNDVLNSKNQQLLSEIQDLRSETSVLEEKAREDLGLVKEGETLFLFVEPKP